MGEAANRAHIDAYLDFLLAQRKLSALTVQSYRRDLAELSTLGKDRPLAAFTPLDIRKLAAQMHARGANPRSIARKLSAWRGFFDWATESLHLAANPAEGVKAPKRAKLLPKALPADLAVKLVSNSRPFSSNGQADHPAGDDAGALCNRAMFELLYSSGLRVSELTGLDTHFIQQAGYRSAGWIDLESGDVHVTGKGNKMRSVPVGVPAMEAIKSWLAVRPLPGTNDESVRHALFLTARATRMSPRVVQLRLKSHAQKLGIPLNVHPHVLRHSFASHVLQSSGDLRAVQEMLGHASISSTQVYTSLDFQRLAQVYDAAHPRARKKEE